MRIDAHRWAPGHLWHLAQRFFQVVTADALSPREESEVAGLLRPEETSLFWDQTRADQRHGLEAARSVLRARPGGRELARAALLHDVGKRHARLGAIGRTMATLLDLMGVRTTGRFNVYLDHARLGAIDLEAVGAEEAVVEFARNQHRPRPASIEPDDWEVLLASDQV